MKKISPLLLPQKCVGSLAVAAFSLLAIASAHGANATWNTQADGDFFSSSNWKSGSTTPYTLGTGDTTVLGDVTGADTTRTVTVGTSGTIGTVQFQQANTTGTNVLSIPSGVTLTIAKGSALLGGTANAAAGVDHAIINLSGSMSLYYNNSSGNTVSFYNTLNLAAGTAIDNNSGTYASYGGDNFFGTVNVDANGGVAVLSKSGGSTGGAGLSSVFNFGSTGILNVNSGELDISRTGPGIGTTLVVTGSAGSQLNVSANATLGLVNYANNKGVAFTNTGSLSQSGTISIRTAQNRPDPAANTFVNNGTWTVSGANAAITQSESVSGTGTIATISGAMNGVLQGASSSDMLTYSNLQAPSSQLALTTTGTIAPGGFGSAGVLTLANTNLISGSTAVLSLDVGGTAAGQYDVLSLPSGALTLTAGDALTVQLINGFTPTAGFSIPVLLFSSALNTIDGAFSLTVNGIANPNWSLQFNGNGTEADLVYAVPEPISCVMIFSGLGLLMGFQKLRGKRRIGI